MSHSRGHGKQVGSAAAGGVVVFSAGAAQEHSNRLGEGVEIEFGGGEEPRYRSRVIGRRESPRVPGLGVVRSRLAAVSHGRVVSTPTTISALRSTRCLVSFWLLYTLDVGKVSGSLNRITAGEYGICRSGESEEDYPGFREVSS
jgi:hypothetical protein